MSPLTLHQFSDSAHPGDAITSYALLLQQWLHEAGIASTLFAETIHPSLKGRAVPLSSYRAQRGEGPALYHHSIGSPVASRLLERSGPLAVIYHNVTPPTFVAESNPALAAKLALGQEQLRQLAPHSPLGIAVSAFNELDLRAAGFAETVVLPLALDERRFTLPPDPEVEARLGEGEWLLFVGRIVPNKRQEDLVRLLSHLRQRRPMVRLALVGERWDAVYSQWLLQQIRALGLEEVVWMPGRVSQAALASCYRSASLYVSMSEHEGVGLPLIESMWMGLPVLAYASSGVPGTLGDAGILFHRKAFPELAELVSLLLEQEALRDHLIAGQRRRATAFSEPVVRERFLEIVAALG